MTIFQKEKESVDFITEGLGIININRFSDDINNSRTIEELTALDIFSHFPVVEREQANQVLFDALPLNGIASVEFVINHVNGVNANFTGVFEQFSGGEEGSIIDGVAVLTPSRDNWFTTPWNCDIVKGSVYSNVLVGDSPTPVDIRCMCMVSQRTGQSMLRSNSALFFAFSNDQSFDCTDGIGSFVPGVGDQGAIPIGAPGTMFIESIACPGLINLGPNLINEFWENNCAIWQVSMRANFRTKTYRFRMILQYE